MWGEAVSREHARAGWAEGGAAGGWEEKDEGGARLRGVQLGHQLEHSLLVRDDDGEGAEAVGAHQRARVEQLAVHQLDELGVEFLCAAGSGRR